MEMNRKAGIVVLAALLCCISACEKDLPKTPGGKVAIIFSIGSTTPEAPRSFSLREPERSEVEIANEENYFLSATLAPDEEGLRAVTTSALIENQKVHLEAYIHSDGTFAGAADYHANAAGQLVLDDPDSPLEVDPAEGPFDFAAYSYYKSTAAISTTSIDPRTDDLIWGHIDNQPITETEAGRTVSFNLKHKFTQVRVKISVSKISGATITNIGTVTIENQSTVDLSVQDGALSNYTNVGALDVYSSLYTGDNITYFSDYYVFHPSPTKVNISSIEITVGGIPKTYSNLFATFTQGLTEAGNYTLAVDLEKFGFAGSNIYWDGERLTFDKVRSASTEQYGGVFFSWGSLIGQDAHALGYKSFFVPPVNEWESWMEVSSTPTFSSPGYQAVAAENYLYDNPNYTSYIGDICSFLTNGMWRMPNVTEFNNIIGSYTRHDGYWATQNGLDAISGRELIPVGITFHTTAGAVFFPVTGYYADTRSGVENGYYWTGTCASPPQAYAFLFSINDGDLHPTPITGWNVTGFPDPGYPVRCIKT
jgi:hypothetical protein